MQKDKIENLEKELESQAKLINIKLNDVSDNLEKTAKLASRTEGASRTSTLASHIQEIKFVDGETKVVVKAKLFLKVNKNIEG